MFQRLFVCIALTCTLVLALVGAMPGRAEGNRPPEEAVITLKRVADVYAGANGSSPRYMAVYDGALYFGANGNDGAGIELWKYTAAGGAQRVADINSGISNSSPSHLAVYNNALYFQAEGGEGDGAELWKYTVAGGPLRVADINTGAVDSYPSYLAVYESVLYFGAFTEETGFELWKYAPASGVQLVDDLYTGTSGSDPADLFVHDGALYFSADGGDGAGKELWQYDPANGARRVEDINTGSGSSGAGPFAVYAGALYFGAYGGDGAGNELWKYDPLNGAQRVADINCGTNGSYPGKLTVYNGALYFSAEGSDGAGRELWKYDLANGAQRVADIYTGNVSSIPLYLALYNGALYFSANGNDGAGAELWMYNTTTTDAFRSVKGLDGWVLESGETTNVGGSLNAAGVTFNLGDDAQDRQYRAILSFDTSTLPDTAVVTGIKLGLRRQAVSGTNPFSTHGNIKVDIRKGPFGTSALQAGDFQAAASKPNIGTITNSPDVNKWYAASLLSTAHAYINPQGITQLRLRFTTDDNDDNGADLLKFYSGNAVALSDRPLLEITYYIP